MITTKFENFLLPEDLIFFENSPEVAIEKNRLENMNKVYFSLTLPNSIKQSLSEKFGLDLSGITKFPMTWIKGDTPHHIDVGSSSFTKTHLLYLNDNPGEFIVNDNSYSITKNTAYVFSEGLSHKTINTGSEPRLLLGPMNEFAHPVGGSIQYYASEANALIYNNMISNGYSYTVEQRHGLTFWRIASNSNGTSPQNILYQAGDVLIDDGVYYLYSDVPVFGSLTYFATQADALANTNSIGSNEILTVFVTGGYTQWRIASNSTGTSSQSIVYTNGDELNFDGDYYLYPAGQTPCFLEGTTILCKVDDVESYLPIETIKPGTLVKTSLNGYKKVELIGKGNINNPGNNERIEKRLYKCSTNKYAELKEDLYITGCHSILVNNITDLQREQSIKQSGKVFVTDKKYRLMACIDERAEPWASEGTYTIWHVALENDNIKMNYGVYANGGLLVETCSINYMRTKANMQLIS